MEWVLVMYIYAGVLARGDSVALASVYGFKSEADCKQAGASAGGLVKGSAKDYRFVCLKK